jgi:hypothetical protein
VEKQAVDWIRWLVREEAYFESESGCAAREALLHSSHGVLRIRDPVPFLTPGSGIQNRFFSGSLIPDPKPIFLRA